jgi:hypothetical protein
MTTNLVGAKLGDVYAVFIDYDPHRKLIVVPYITSMTTNATVVATQPGNGIIRLGWKTAGFGRLSNHFIHVGYDTIPNIADYPYTLLVGEIMPVHSRVSGCITDQDAVDMLNRIIAANKPDVAINNHICPTCGNTRVSACEKSCWRCGNSLHP